MHKNPCQPAYLEKWRPRRTIRRSATLHLEEFSDGAWAVTARAGQGWDRRQQTDPELLRWAEQITTSWSVQIPQEGETPADIENRVLGLLAEHRRVVLWQRLWPFLRALTVLTALQMVYL